MDATTMKTTTRLLFLLASLSLLAVFSAACGEDGFQYDEDDSALIQSVDTSGLQVVVAQPQPEPMENEFAEPFEEDDAQDLIPLDDLVNADEFIDDIEVALDDEGDDEFPADEESEDEEGSGKGSDVPIPTTTEHQSECGCDQ